MQHLKRMLNNKFIDMKDFQYILSDESSLQNSFLGIMSVEYLWLKIVDLTRQEEEAISVITLKQL